MAIGNSFLGEKGALKVLGPMRCVGMLGIGGIGMYSIARQLLERGVTVYGCDRVENIFINELRQLGADISISETLSLRALEECRALIYTAAAEEKHPLIVEAGKRGLPIVSRADALAFLMADRTPKIAVAGSHGKSTVTAMTAHLFADDGKKPTMVCGAMTVRESSPYCKGKGAYIFEACEYMDSFLSFSPDIAVVTNIDLDHTDFFPDEGAIINAFVAYLRNSRQSVISLDCPRAKMAAQKSMVNPVFFSLSDKSADCYAERCRNFGDGTSFHLFWQGSDCGEVRLPMLGEYNIANALAASSAALLYGISPEQICQTLLKEKGVRRRMEYKGSAKGVFFYDDYAHHPKEIESALAALRERTEGRLVCVFQSHTYTRTAAHLSEIAQALRIADAVLVTEIYAARETDTLGMSAQRISEAVGEKAYAVGSIENAATALSETVREGDTAIVMGAGNIGEIFSFLPFSLQ